MAVDHGRRGAGAAVGEPDEAGAFLGAGADPAGDGIELRVNATGVVVGGVRFEALVREGVTDEGGIDELAFFLDGEPILTRRRPPYTVELDLGDVPRPHTMRAVGYDAEGREVAADELVVNAGDNRFRVARVDGDPQHRRALDEARQRRHVPS